MKIKRTSRIVQRTSHRRAREKENSAKKDKKDGRDSSGAPSYIVLQHSKTSFKDALGPKVASTFSFFDCLFVRADPGNNDSI